MPDVALRLLPGALLLLALRSALTGADWRWTALLLALSLPVHLADLVFTPQRRRAHVQAGGGVRLFRKGS